MRRKLLAFSMTFALLLSAFSAANVGAHTVTIENAATVGLTPSRTDWFGVQPDQSGEGIIQRNKAQQGEFVFNDATRDQRLINTTVVTRAADLDWFSVTADANNIYFLAKVDRYNGITQTPSIELMITIDTDHVASSTASKVQLPLATSGISQTSVPADAAWEYVVNPRFSAGNGVNPYVNGTTRIWTNAGGTQTSSTCASCASQLAGAAVNQGSFAEVAVPWTSIGGKPTGANFLRFTVSSMYSNTPNRSIPNDGYNSPVIDVLGIGSTLADIQDGTINTSFDVHFDTNPAPVNATYEPYSPLTISEFQPNPINTDDPTRASATDSEWIEIYNPNTFAITLSDYKIGNAAKRDATSSQGMFKFKASSIASKAVVIVARSKSKFLAAHPGYSGTVYDLSADMTRYTAWSAGTTIDLNNSPTPPATNFEEQVVLLDAKDDIVDLVNYGNPVTPYPGNVPIVTASVPEGASYERCPVLVDTNGGFDRIEPALNNTDFVAHNTTTEQTPGIACLGKPGIDMAIVKTAGTTNGQAGVDSVVFTLSYSNVGSSDEVGGATVTITDTLPAGLTYAGSSSDSTNVVPTVNGKTITWSGVTPPSAGGVASTILVSATIDAGTPDNTALVNKAGISSPNEPTNAQQAGVRTNNFAEAAVTTIGPAVLNLSFEDLGGNTPPNAQFTFVLNYSNIGQDDATDTTVALNIPANVTILSADSEDARPNFSTPVSGPAQLTWTVSNLPSNTGGTITLVGQVSGAAADGSTLAFTATANSGAVTATTSASQTVAFNKIFLPFIKK